MKNVSRMIVCAAVALLWLAGVSLCQAEEGEFQVMSPWVSSGTIYQVGPHTIKLIGVSKGVLYFEDTAMEEVDTALMKCPYSTVMDDRDGKTTTTGQCIIATRSGEIVWADLECTGAKGMCQGTFTITGGTGDLSGLKGSSPLYIRTAIGAVQVDPINGRVVKDSSGLATMPKLRLSLPEEKM